MNLTMKTLFSLLLLYNSLTAFSQNFHVDLSLGAANYYGDLQSKRYTFNQSKIAIGIGLSYELSEKLSVRAGFTRAKVSGDDKHNLKTTVRNLNFTSSISEFHLAGQYFILNTAESSIAPYIFGGIAAFQFNPYTYDTVGTKFFLQPLSTEGQGFYQDRKPYKLTQFAIPFGGGAKMALSENIHVGIEIGFRKLFTDYLDDVSTTYIDPNLLIANRGAKSFELAFRANELKTSTPYPLGDIRGGEKLKDWYYFTMFTTSFRIGGGGEGRTGRKSKLGCPTRI